MEEKNFNSKRNVKYIYEENANSDFLIIIFSAFSPKGQPPMYNYIKTLNGVDCNKLFILDDFGSIGSYYLSFEENNNYIEESVMGLINSICVKDNIHKNNIITVGSSKGGFSALYYAIKYKFGYTIAGSPQIFVGKYLKSAKQYDVIDNFLDQTTEEVLNSSLINLNSYEEFPQIYIHVGKEEQHHYEHVNYFVDKFRIKELDLGDYNTHRLVSLYFPQYLTNTLSKILGKPYIKDIIYYKNENDNNYIFKGIANGIGLRYAWYILDGTNNGVIEKFNYSFNDDLKYLFKEQGIYKATFFIKDSQKNILSKTTSRIII